MKKRLIAFLLLSCLAGIALPSRAYSQEATAYAIADATSCHILDARKPDKKLPIASLTKIASALVVFDWLDVSKQDQSTLVPIPPSALAANAANNPVGFQEGDQASIRDLLYAMLVQSDNIAAYALANYVGRDLQRGFQTDGRPTDLFVAQMNALARKLGMKSTKFLNPAGEDAESPYSTARDLVLLTSTALQRSAFRFIVSQRERQITRRTATGASVPVRLANTNQLLGINAIDGVKTGQSARAGECVVISAARAPESVQIGDGQYQITPRRLIVVVLGSTNRFNDAKQLLNDGWNLYDDWAAQGRPLEK